MTGVGAGQGPPQRESRPVGSGPAEELSTSIKNTTSVLRAASWVPAPPPIPTVEGYLAGLGSIPRPASCASCEYGLIFEADRRCPRHWTADDRALVDDLNKRGRAIGLPVDRTHRLEGQRVWPYGPRSYVAMRVAMLDWAEAAQLRYADRSHACTAWLKGERCPGVQRCAGLGRDILRWLDHASTWTGPAGLRLVVAQPYAVTPCDAPALQALSGVDGLHVTVAPPGGGWYAQTTWTVLIAGFTDVQTSDEAAA